MMTQTTNTPLRRDELFHLLRSYLQLEADVAALVEDNRQLRAALRMFSEAARNAPDTLPLRSKAVA